MPLFFRRLIETLIVILLSSLPIYAIAKFGGAMQTKAAYFFLFGISSLIFLALTFVTLRAYMEAVCNIRLYYATNITLLLIQIVLWIVALNFFSNDLYTAFFGYTKVFRALDFSPVASGVIIYIIYFIMIIHRAIDFVKWERNMQENQME